MCLKPYSTVLIIIIITIIMICTCTCMCIYTVVYVCSVCCMSPTPAFKYYDNGIRFWVYYTYIFFLTYI